MAISKKQMQILAFPYTKYDCLICDGAIRSGKTSFMAVAFIDDAMRRYNKQRFGICGKTVDSTVKNIIAPYMAMTLPKEKYAIRWRRTDKLLVVSDGERENYFEVFGGKDEASFALIQGRTLAGALIDEVALQPRSFVEQALARCSVTGSKLWFNCNPGSPQHWFYQEWICQPGTKNALHLHFELDDNPALSDNIKDRYRAMYSGVFYDRYIRGLWVVAEGLIYPMFGAQNIVDAEPKSGRYYISVDYGTLNPFSAGLWCLDGNGATRIREYYHSGRTSNETKTDEEYYSELVKLAGNYPVEQVIIDPSAASFITTVFRHNKFRVAKARNDVLDGIRTTAVYLKSGKIKVHKGCKDAIREFGVYRWDDKSTDDRPIKENDHCLTGDTLVWTDKGKVKISDLVGKSGKVYCTNGRKVRKSRFHGVRMTKKEAEVFEVRLSDGQTIKATAEHKFLTKRGWIKLKDLRTDDEIACIGGANEGFLSYLAIESVKSAGKEPVYNMEVLWFHNFAVNGGAIVHNCMDEIRYFAMTVMRRFFPVGTDKTR